MEAVEALLQHAKIDVDDPPHVPHKQRPMGTSVGSLVVVARGERERGR
jgi:hypothetical protein